MAAARAAGFRVLIARPVAAEVKLSFSALADLLDGVELDGLEEPHRRALEVTLLRAEADAPEPSAVAAAFLVALHALDPVLVAVDDVQWLDPDSAHALAFAARRAPFRFLLAARPRASSALLGAVRRSGLERIELGPLSERDLRRLLEERLGLWLPRRLLLRIADASRGNPLFALELGRVLLSEGLPDIGEEIALPDALEDLVGARVLRLRPEVRRLVLAVALGGDLPVGRLAEPGVLDEAVEAGVLVVERDRIRLDHPLLGAAARQRSKASERRELHLALAGVATDERRRARHLALATLHPDAELAARVSAAAAEAGARGAAQEAAELARHALRLTPPDAPERHDRVLALADTLDVAGEDRGVTLLLEPELERLPPGPQRARAYLLLAEAGIVDHIDDARDHIDRALEEAGDDPRTRTSALSYGAIHAAVAAVADVEAADAMAEQAVAEQGVDASMKRYALFSLAWTRAMRSRDIDDVCERHAALAVPAEQLYHAVVRVSALRHMWRGEVREARTALHALLATAEERGEGWSTAAMRLHLCELALRTGEWDLVAGMLRDWDQPSGEAHVAGPQRDRCAALLAAGRGDAAEAERMAAIAIEGATATGVRWDELEARRAAGIAALLRGDAEEAVARLRWVWDYVADAGVLDPGVFPVAADLVDAGGDADAVIARLRELPGHPWARATLLRCEGAFEAVEAYRALGLEFDAARTLLALGRREEAAAAFDALGSPGWAARAEPRSRPPAPRRGR